jgi:hypothetical protein
LRKKGRHTLRQENPGISRRTCSMAVDRRRRPMKHHGQTRSETISMVSMGWLEEGQCSEESTGSATIVLRSSQSDTDGTPMFRGTVDSAYRARHASLCQIAK